MYTKTLMQFAYAPFLPPGMSWQQLFDVIVVSAYKPEFFTTERRPVYEIVQDVVGADGSYSEFGMMRERFEYKSSPSSLQAGAARDIHGNALPSNAFAGGNAKMIEKRFGVSGAQVPLMAASDGCRISHTPPVHPAAASSSAQVLYVGDHIFTDVNMAKRGLSWRTCMILQELELEVEGLERGRERTLKLQRLFRNKDEHSAVLNFLQTKLDGRGELDEGELVEGAIDAASGCGDSGEGDDCDAGSDAEEHARLLSRLSQLRASLDVVESEISGLLWDDGAHVNRYWGYTTRAGFADKSHLMRQIEKYADIYTSRVSNFLRYTPYKHFICGRQTLTHDREDDVFHWKVSEYGDDDGTGY